VVRQLGRAALDRRLSPAPRSRRAVSIRRARHRCRGRNDQVRYRYIGWNGCLHRPRRRRLLVLRAPPLVRSASVIGGPRDGGSHHRTVRRQRRRERSARALLPVRCGRPRDRPDAHAHPATPGGRTRTTREASPRGSQRSAKDRAAASHRIACGVRPIASARGSPRTRRPPGYVDAGAGTAGGGRVHDDLGFRVVGEAVTRSPATDGSSGDPLNAPRPSR
jgi:hypothetical protein